MMNWIESMTPFWQQWILLSLPGAILLYLLVELISRYGQMLSPRLRYWLFIGVLLKCIMPPLLWVSIPILSPKMVPLTYTVPDSYQGYEFAIQNQAPVIPITKIPSIEQETLWQSLSWIELLFIGQLIGTAIILCFLIYRLVSLVRIRQVLRDEETGALCGRLCTRLKMRMPRLYAAPDEMGACAGGFFTPYIVIPKSVLHVSREHQELVIVHELIHVQRMDHIVNWLQVAVFAVFWWHPIIWRMNYLIRCERELCCDERVVQELAIEPVKYSQLLVDAAERQILHNQFQWQSAFANPAHAFQNRIRRIVTMKHITKTTRWLSAIIIVYLICGITVGFQFVQAQTDEKEMLLLLEKLEDMKSIVKMIMLNQKEIPEDLKQSIYELQMNMNNHFVKNYSEQSDDFLKTKRQWENQQVQSVLDYRTSILLDNSTYTLKELLESLDEFVNGDVRGTFQLKFLYGDGVDINREIQFNTRGGSPTIRELMNRTLKPLGIAYKEFDNNVCFIYKQRNKNDWEPSQSQTNVLQTKVPGGITAPGIELKRVIGLLNANTGLNYVLAEGAGEKVCIVNITGNPTLKEILDGILPPLNLGYAVIENKIIRIDTIDQIKQFNEENVPKTVNLNKKINGGVVAPGVPLNDVIQLLSLNTGYNFEMAEGVGDTMCTLNITGNPTLKEILNAMLPSLGMAYTVTENNVIVIDEKVEQ